ncbi:MAG: gamma-glutamyltransferase, partial [Actinomycetota bacterium]
FGTKALADLAAPAARLAREGIDRSPGLAKITDWSRPILEADAEAARIFLAPGRLVQPELADVLEDLENFYDGAVAQAAPAPFTSDDFAAHRVAWVDPPREIFAGVEVCEMPPNSRGYLVLEAIRRLERLDDLTPSDAEWHRRLIAASRAAASGGDTVYLCVVDAEGMAVSINQSLFQGFGSGVVVPATGVLLHNRAAYHTPQSYRGGAKPIHTLSPAMGLVDGRPRVVFGTMGGDAQVQIHLQLLTRILVAGEPVEEAIAAPRWQFTGSTLLVEDGLPPLDELLPDLEVEPMPTPELAGHAHAILIEEDGLHAAADPRSDGIPVGF